MARFYYLGPWVLDEKLTPHYRAPDGVVGVVDLSPSTAPGSVGFFTTDAPIKDPKGYAAFGDEKGTRLEEIVLDDAARKSWAQTLGMAEVPASATLVDLLWDTLTIHSDAKGATGPKPIMPTGRGRCELHLGGHSLVKAVNLPADATTLPHWDKIREVLQDDYRAVKATADAALTQKGQTLNARWLGFQQEKYGLTDAATIALLIPDDLPFVAPIKPETTITDDFDRADGDTIGNQLSWTEFEGDIDTVSNKAAGKTDPGFTSARADSDLSGSDHYAQAVIRTQANFSYPGVCFRKDSTGTLTYYCARIIGTGPDQVLYKVVSGSLTKLGSTHSAHSGATDYTVRGTANGSTISFDRDSGAETESVTDTSITTGLRCGITGYNGNVDDSVWNSFEAADLGGGVVAAVGARSHRIPSLAGRR